MDAIQLTVKPRPAGKGAARAARRIKEVPGVLYGHHITPVTFQVAELALRDLIYTNEKHTVELTVDGETYEAILKEVVFHPVTDRPFHVDFQALTRGELVTMTVPVQFVGRSKGVELGGTLNPFLHEIEIKCMPRHIPGHIEVDVTNLDGGDTLHVEDLVAPEGITFTAHGDVPVVTVTPLRKEADSAE